MIYLGDCIEIMKSMEKDSIDCVITSPPYDDLRNYDNTCTWNFDKFKEVANQLYRIIKDGGVIIWVVGDKTENGSETGTSFKQALYFKEIGFNIHDTMIYRKLNYVPLTHNRYEQEFEYMFCFSKDPFIGSGSTAVMAKKLKRNYIGIDISEEYCKLSEERLEKEVGKDIRRSLV